MKSKTVANPSRLRGRTARAAALGLLALAAVLLQAREARAQWTQPDAQGNINNTNSGNVGVGTTTPAAKLSVADAAAWPASNIGAVYVNASNSVGAGLNLHSGATGGRNYLLLSTGGGASPGGGAFGIFDATLGGAAGYRFVLNSAGNVGVGNLNPAHKLDVAGNVNASSGLCIAGDCKSAWSQVGATQWTTAGGNIHYNSGNVGVGTASPNQKLGVHGMVGLYPQAWAMPSTRGMFMFHGGSGGSIYAYNYPGGTADPISMSAQSLDFNTYIGGAPHQRMFISNAGNVGIGTSSPSARLQVTGAGAFGVTGGAEFRIHNTAAGAVFSQQVGDSGFWQLADAAASATKIQVFPGLNGAINFYSGTGNVVMHGTGNVGIGTNAPSTKLHVVGDVTVTGNIAAKFQDVAEWVPSTQELKAGTVVVLDPERTNHVVASSTAYDTRVAGVVSAQPGVILGERGDGKLMVATTGRVRIKADATRAAIKVGDLLVTSDTEGVAMKSVPIDLAGTPIHRPGTLIGKALEPLEKGTGEILVLLSLQ